MTLITWENVGGCLLLVLLFLLMLRMDEMIEGEAEEQRKEVRAFKRSFPPPESEHDALRRAECVPINMPRQRRR
jgi:hypothetical protein